VCFAKTSFDWQTVASASRRLQTRLARFNAIAVSIRFILLILCGHKQIALENAKSGLMIVQPEIREVGGLHHRYERRAA